MTIKSSMIMLNMSGIDLVIVVTIRWKPWNMVRDLRALKALITLMILKILLVPTAVTDD